MIYPGNYNDSGLEERGYQNNPQLPVFIIVIT